jgi:hypothetical protein
MLTLTQELANMREISDPVYYTAREIIEQIQYRGPLTIAEIEETLNNTLLEKDTYIKDAMDILICAGFISVGEFQGVVAYEVM